MIGGAGICTASANRKNEWHRCCAVASGFEWVDHFDTDIGNDDANESDNLASSSKNQSISSVDEKYQVTNLLDFEDDDDYGAVKYHQNDAWTENALRIQTDLNRMSHWIQSKKLKYVGLDMKDEEAALIQSTVTSFAATIASELETLRNMIKSYTNSRIINNNLSNHRSGIVQILLDQLQEQVTKPFGILQKQRGREAVRIWQNPLQCQIQISRSKRRTSQQPQDIMFDDEGEDQQNEQRFLPERPHQGSDNSSSPINNENSGAYDFISKYANKQSTSVPTTPPSFLTRISKRQCLGVEGSHPRTASFSQTPQKKEQPSGISLPSFSDVDALGASTMSQRVQSRPTQDHLPPIDSNNEYYQQQLEEDLQAESAQLTATLIANNDLDSVQQMETRMVEITTLIGQFSDLVQDQQEQVQQVHESAKETKDNLDKGQENLVDAAERTKQSKHYKAYLILAMATILMFFHILRN